MQDYDLMKNSVMKNIQELSEFLVDDFKVNNYYDLLDKIIYINNIVVMLKKKNNILYKEITKELEEV